jgi:hypothetical protein
MNGGNHSLMERALEALRGGSLGIVTRILHICGEISRAPDEID